MASKQRTLEILDRVIELEMDQFRLQLVSLQKQRDSIQSQITKLRDVELVERSLASKFPQDAYTMPAFTDFTSGQISKLQMQIERIDSDIENVLNNVNIKYKESKQIEITLNKEKEKLSALERRQEQKVFDQLAEIRHRSNEPAV